MAHWDDVQKRARRIIDEGMKLLKSGMNEAEYIAEATAESTRLHIVARRNRFDMYKALHDLGQKVYDVARKAPSSRELTLTDAMMRIVDRVEGMAGEAKKAEAKISKLTVTKKGVSKARKTKRASKRGQ